LVGPDVVPDIATDFLSAPTAHGHEPPRSWDLRWVFGGTMTALFLAGLIIWGARGRRA
jgi:hypothetical protein